MSRSWHCKAKARSLACDLNQTPTRKIIISEILKHVSVRTHPSTRWRHPHLGTYLPLEPSDQFLTDNLPSLTQSIHLRFFSDETLNSSMMFSSMLTDVQSFEPHCPDCLALATLTSSSASQSRLQFLLLTFLFTCSRNPPVYPSSVVPLQVVH